MSRAALFAKRLRGGQHQLSPEPARHFPRAARRLQSRRPLAARHAKENNLDPDRFAAWGASAGGHLVALLGTAGDAKKFDVGANLDVSSRVQAWWISLARPTSRAWRRMRLPGSRIDHDAPDAAEAKLIGGPVQQNKDKCAAANPITYVAKNNPPFLIMHGNKDDIVPYQQSELLRDALQKAGVPVTFKIVEGAGHGFGGADIDRQVAAFFDSI
jgi:dipeptidyl aminopeptidase/acylaminoacyl peptidase